jgi:hypothetical protein
MDMELFRVIMHRSDHQLRSEEYVRAFWLEYDSFVGGEHNFVYHCESPMTLATAIRRLRHVSRTPGVLDPRLTIALDSPTGYRFVIVFPTVTESLLSDF